MKDKIGFELLNIDREAKTFKRIEIKETSKDLEDYIFSLRTSIIDEKETRMYNMKAVTTEVMASVIEIVKSAKNLAIHAQVVAKRLLSIEVDTQTRYDHIADIRKGSLFITRFMIDNSVNVLIVKIEHSPFIDEADLKKHIGLPFENEVLKSCLFQFDNDNELLSILAHDSNGTIASYWWNNFLELEEISSDAQNTQSAFNAIELYLARKIKPYDPSDYTIFRNNLIGYFKTNKKFGIKKMIEVVIGDYESNNKNIDMNLVKNGIIELPKKKHFDASFSILPGEISARIRKTIKINDTVDIRINEYTKDLRSVIRSVDDTDGKKYIQILASDEAYETFKYKED